MKKTPKMLLAEGIIGGRLEDNLKRLLADNSLTETAEMLRISKQLLYSWMLLFGVSVRKVAVYPDEKIVICKRNVCDGDGKVSV